MRGLLDDLRQAARLLHRQPGFSLFAVVTLALGIGAATTMFTLVRAVLLHDLPITEPHRLAWMYNARTERDRAPFSIADLDDYARGNTTLAGLAPFTNWTANLTGSAEAERLEGTRVAGNFFAVLGARAALGRTLEPRDETGDARSAVLTHGLWLRRFGADRSIVGNSVTLNGAAYTVVGILPPDFMFPFRQAEVAVPLPLSTDARRSDRGANFLRVVARLKPGVTFERAKADLDAIAHRLQRQFPIDDARKVGVNLYPLHTEIVSDYRQILWILFAAVGVLLTIGCGNLANLLLVRAVARAPEFALRASLGAPRARIVRQLVIEASTLAALGAIAGIVVAVWSVSAWRAFGPSNFPRMSEAIVDPTVLAFAIAVSALVAIVCGGIPAWMGSRRLAAGLGHESRAATAARRQGFLRRAFVALQVAGASVLLVCALLVGRGVARLARVDPGFSPERALSMQLALPPNRYTSREDIIRFHDALADRFTRIAGVKAAGAVSLLPLSGLLSAVDLAFPDRPAPPPDEVPQAHFRIAGPDYFSAAGIRVTSGREFTVRDTGRGRPVAIVSQTFASRHWHSESAVGKSLRVVQGQTQPILEVVGVVSDVKQYGLDGAPTADLYVPLHQMPAFQTSGVVARVYWVIRTEGAPAMLAPAARRAVHAVDPDVATSSIRAMDDVFAAAVAPQRTNQLLLMLFGAAALVLASMGVYAIAAFSTRSRRREIAIRVAFGAGRSTLLRLIVGEELRPVVVGVGIGLVAAAGIAGQLSNLLFATSSRDPAAYVAVATILFAVGGLATAVPAARASRVDPAELLRQ